MEKKKKGKKNPQADANIYLLVKFLNEEFYVM